MAIYKESSILANSAKGTEVYDLTGKDSADPSAGYALPENSTQLMLYHSDVNEVWLMQFFADGVVPLKTAFSLANSLVILPTAGFGKNENRLVLDIGPAGARPGYTTPWFYGLNVSGGQLEMVVTVTNQVSNLTPGQKITGYR